MPGYGERYFNWDYPAQSRDYEADSMTHAEILRQTKSQFAAAVPLIRAEGARQIRALRARDRQHLQAYLGGWGGMTQTDVNRAITYVRNLTDAYASHRAPDKVPGMAWKRVVASYKRLFPMKWYEGRGRLGLRTRAGYTAWQLKRVTAEEARARDAYVLSRRQRLQRRQQRRRGLPRWLW